MVKVGAVAAFLTLSTAISLHAQAFTGSVRGLVTDPSGSVIPKAVITISNTFGFTRTVETDLRGRYTLTGVNPGLYTFRASATGFALFEQNSFAVKSDVAQTLDVALSVRTQADQVTVAADTVQAVGVDPSSNADALVLQKAELDALSDDPDDLAADLQALAGPAAGPNGGQVYIDGFTGGRLPPKNTIREVRINQNPFAAQFDRPGQGRVEIFTKPGSEEFHGELLFQFSDAALNSRNPFVTTKPPYQRRQWEGEVNGPIGKKTSFFVDFERRDINENALINALVLDANLNVAPFTQAVQTPLTGIESNVRIDRQLSTNHTLTVRYGFNRDTNDNGGVGGFALPTQAYRMYGTEQTIQINETAILNARTINEFRFRFRRQNNEQSGAKSVLTTVVLDAFTGGGPSAGTSFDRQNRYEIQNFTSRVAGAHNFRFGGLLRGVTLDNQAMQNYAGAFTFTSLSSYRQTLLGIQNGLTHTQIRAMGGGASQFTLSTGNPLASLSQFDWGAFVQDEWRIRPNLTISAGLRYEAQTHSGDRGDVGPRLSLAWAPGRSKAGTPKNVIRAGFGMFYDRISESLSLDAVRQDGIRQQRYLITNPDFYPAIPNVTSLMAAPQTIRKTDANWRSPALLQTAIGYERQLPGHITISTNYIRSASAHALRSRNINAPYPGATVLPYGGANALYLYESSGVYRQHQLITQVNARINPRLTISGSYVYGQAMSNTDGAGTFPANQYDLRPEWGRAGFDLRHRFQLNGSVALRHGIRFSPFVTLTSGRPFNITAGKDLNGDGLYTDRPAFAGAGVPSGVRITPFGTFDPNPQPGETIVPRNYGNGPGMVSVNLRVSKAFNLGKHEAGKDSERQIILGVNARNLLNHPNYSLPDGNLSSPLFGQSTSLVGGQGSSGNRRLDLQIRFAF